MTMRDKTKKKIFTQVDYILLLLLLFDVIKVF